MSEIKDKILRAALQNALEHGKTNEKIILGKILGIEASLRNQIKEIMPEIKEIVTYVNQISKDQIDFKRLNQNHIKLIEQKKKQHELSFYLPDSYDLSRGIVKKVGEKYSIIDGFHRIISFDKVGTFPVYCKI